MLLSQLAPGVPEVFATIQGEGTNLGVPSVFVRLAECNLKCEWCFVPETPILLADWTWKPIGQLEPGDEVVGYAEGGGRRHGKLAIAKVTRVARSKAATVTVNDAVRCTPDHRFWLTGKDANRRSAFHHGWREVERSVGARALFVTAPMFVENRSNYQRGWLAGISDGDGCFWTLKYRRGYRRYRLAVNDLPLLDRAEAFARSAGHKLRRGVHSKRGFTGLQTMPCLWMTKDGETRAFEDWLATDLADESWSAGYLGGILDAEGSHSRGVLRISQEQVNQPTRARISRVLTNLGLGFTTEERGFYIHRSNGGAWRALAFATPAKERLVTAAFSHHPHASRVIKTVLPTDQDEEVVQVTTTTGSFVAAGYVVKNCDTKYTWDWGHYDRDRETVELPIEAVLEAVRAKTRNVVRNVVITGGEPLLQQEELVALGTELVRDGIKIEVETNGAIEPVAALAALVTQWNVSPKLANSGNALTARVRGGPLAWFTRCDRAIFKFVVANPNDLDEVEGLAARFSIDRGRILLMPEGTDPETIADRGRWLAEKCTELGFRMTTRLHVSLWQSRRGK